MEGDKPLPPTHYIRRLLLFLSPHFKPLSLLRELDWRKKDERDYVNSIIKVDSRNKPTSPKQHYNYHHDNCDWMFDSECDSRHYEMMSKKGYKPGYSTR